METLEHNGATYVKVSVLAKRFNYTTDYIGQLCRQGKVEAKLVGRSWFVREDSLLQHGADRLKVTRPNEILSKINLDSTQLVPDTANRVAVFPQLSKHSHRNLLAGSNVIPVHSLNTQTPPARSSYVADETDAFPKFNYLKTVVTPTSESEMIIEKPSPGEKVHVHAEIKSVKKLHFSHLPEVLLQGNLPVVNLDAEAEYEDSTPVSLAEVPQLVTPPVLKPPLRPKKPISPPPLQSAVTTVHPRPTVLKKIPSPNSSSPGFSFFLPLVLLFSCMISATVLSLSTLVTSDGSVLNQSLDFNLAQVSESLHSLR